MANYTHNRFNTRFKYIDSNETLKKIHSLSVSTDYQSETGELLSSQTVDDHVSDYLSKSDHEKEVNEYSDYTLEYSEVLTDLNNKAKILESGSQMCESLNEIFSDLCNIEYQYVERLRLLKDKIDLKTTFNSTNNINVLSSFKSYLTKMSENHSDFLDSISNECFLETKDESFLKINKEIANLKKELDNFKSDRVSYLEKMQESYLKSKNAVSVCLDATHQAPSIKTSVHKAVIPVILNFITVNNVVYENDGFDRFLNFNNRVDSIISSLKELEKKRCCEINDVINKFMIYETSKVRNLQYDLNSLIETLNNFEIPENLNTNNITGNNNNKDNNNTNNEKENKENENNKDNVIKTSKYLQFMNNEMPKATNQLFPTTSIRPPPYRVISKIENNMERFLDCLWGDVQVVSLREFIEEIQSSLVRQIFCDLLSKNGSSHSEFESLEKFQLLVDMVNSILFVSERQADYWCGYSILKFSDQFYTSKEGSEEDKCYLYSKISTNTYWRRSLFWEECLTIILSLDLKALFETSSCLIGTITQINCVPSTEDPSRFYNWMLRFEIPHTECEELIHRVCRRFKLPESYINSIIHQD